MKFLLVEDDKKIVQMLSLVLKMRWPHSEVLSTSRGEDGINLAGKQTFDAIILDLGLPDSDGMDVLRDIRLFSKVPIVILTVRNEESEIIRGLELGADEYITKPFSQMELLARVNCVMRRKTNIYNDSPLIVGKMNLDWAGHCLEFDGRQILLTATETKILHQLMINANKSVSITSIAELVWGEEYPDCGKAIRVYLRRIREKLEKDPSSPQIILTRPGIGYELHI